LKTQIVTAELLSAEGKPDDAARNLRRTIKLAQTSGFFTRQLEAALILARIEAKSGKKTEARALFQSVERDARSKGYLLIAREAAAERS
jgi:TolA-binding protein